MKSLIDRLKSVVSYSEIECLKHITSEMNGRSEAIIVTSKIADAERITRSVIVGALKLLEVAGVIESRSLGKKGTYIKILDQSALNQLIV